MVVNNNVNYHHHTRSRLLIILIALNFYTSLPNNTITNPICPSFSPWLSIPTTTTITTAAAHFNYHNTSKLYTKIIFSQTTMSISSICFTTQVNGQNIIPSHQPTLSHQLHSLPHVHYICVRIVCVSLLLFIYIRIYVYIYFHSILTFFSSTALHKSMSCSTSLSIIQLSFIYTIIF